jgi:hypothetical protein
MTHGRDIMWIFSQNEHLLKVLIVWGQSANIDSLESRQEKRNDDSFKD